jgi:hypothetical protein
VLTTFSARRLPEDGRGAGRALAAKLALFACLVASLGVRPVVEHLHYLFASHDHRFCPEHQRIEDVPRTSPRLGFVPDSEQPHDGNAGLRNEKFPAGTSHVACSVLNGHPGGAGQFVLSQGTTHLVCCVLGEKTLESSERPLLRQSEQLSLAPKRSPPPAVELRNSHC